MAIRFAGVANVMVDGNQIALRGDLTVSPNSVERNMIAGQDSVHGYQELPIVPYIELTASALPNTNIEDLERQTDVTVVAQLANNKQYSLTQATCKANIQANAREGSFRVRWEGMRCEEMGIG
jgi:hypothetical protein